MKLRYRVVTLSFCPDLVDPDSMSVPFASLVVGKSDKGRWTAFAMGLDVKGLGLDPLLGAMLGDVPNLVRSHLDSAMKRVKGAADLSPELVLREFHEVLRTNIHVSSLSEEGTLDVDDVMKLSHLLFDVAADALRTQLEKQLDDVDRAPRTPSAPKVAPESLFEVPPAHMQWVPPTELPAAA